MPGLSTGSALSTASSACVPPVDVPSATTRSVVSLMARWGAPDDKMASADSLAGIGAALGAAAILRTRAWAAALTTAMRSSDSSSRYCLRLTLGLATMLTAPAAMACIVVSAPCGVSVEQITTGVGRSAMSLRRKVRPSMRGISTSSTITSGHSLAMCVIAKTGSAAAPMTLMARSAASLCVKTWRTTAESSTISTRMGLPMFNPIGCSRSRGGSSAACRSRRAGFQSG